METAVVFSRVIRAPFVTDWGFCNRAGRCSRTCQPACFFEEGATETIPHAEYINQASCGIVLGYNLGVKMLTTVEAAQSLGITPRRVRALIANKQLPAQKLGRDYFIDPKDLTLVKNRKPGRPKKLTSKRTSK